MIDKSHVSLEQHVCLVCGVAFDTGARSVPVQCELAALLNSGLISMKPVGK
ncbi:hypothetical protein [Variovorax sp.]|jgi:hypothetical protein|uniref:hypothetical protein n=1 Tax=Variovorax sp. TaxID=1871043 RepID=UPI0037DA4BBA